MTRKFLIALAALALASFGLVACGGDDDDEGTDTAATETTEDTTEEGAGGAAGGEGGTLEIQADPNGALEYTTGALETEAGAVTIEFDNPANIEHDVRIEDDTGQDVGGTEVITNDSTTAEVDLEPGTYTYYCSVPGHREAGMEEALTVE